MQKVLDIVSTLIMTTIHILLDCIFNERIYKILKHFQKYRKPPNFSLIWDFILYLLQYMFYNC